MSTEELYEELGVTQTVEEQDQFFNELIDSVQNGTAHLGRGREKQKYRQSLVEEIKLRQAELKSCTAEFSHALEVYPLTAKDFHSHGYTIPPKIASDLKKYKFAMVNIPIMLVPVKGWGFTTLDCIATFNPDRSGEHPVAHQLFPSELWVEKIKFSQQVAIGVDEYFNFKVVGGAPGIADGGIDTAGQGGFRLLLGPYDYSVRLPRVIARGTGNDKVRWTLEGEENIQQHELKLGVVLKVPRKVKQVEVVSVMTLSRQFHTFSADVKYLVEGIWSRGKEFFKKGTPPRLPEGVWDITQQLKEA